jgi:hypothetical protein
MERYAALGLIWYCITGAKCDYAIIFGSVGKGVEIFLSKNLIN